MNAEMQPLQVTRNTIRPLAIACYIFPGIMAVLFMAGVAKAGRLTDASSPFIAYLWQIGLLSGSIIALLGVLFQLQSWPGGLIIEATGTLTLGLMLGVYGTVLWLDNGPTATPWWTVLSTLAISLGCIGRTAQAFRERGRALRAAAVVMQR